MNDDTTNPTNSTMPQGGVVNEPVQTMGDVTSPTPSMSGTVMDATVPTTATVAPSEPSAAVGIDPMPTAPVQETPIATPTSPVAEPMAPVDPAQSVTQPGAPMTMGDSVPEEPEDPSTGSMPSGSGM